MIRTELSSTRVRHSPFAIWSLRCDDDELFDEGEIITSMVVSMNCFLFVGVISTVAMHRMTLKNAHAKNHLSFQWIDCVVSIQMAIQMAIIMHRILKSCGNTNAHSRMIDS